MYSGILFLLYLVPYILIICLHCCYTTLKLQALATNAYTLHRELQTKCVKIHTFEEKAQRCFMFIFSLNGRGKKKNNVETFVSISEDDRLGKANANSCSGNCKMYAHRKRLRRRKKKLWTFNQRLEKTSKIKHIRYRNSYIRSSLCSHCPEHLQLRAMDRH